MPYPSLMSFIWLKADIQDMESSHGICRTSNLWHNRIYGHNKQDNLNIGTLVFTSLY